MQYQLTMRDKMWRAMAELADVIERQGEEIAHLRQLLEDVKIKQEEKEVTDG